MENNVTFDTLNSKKRTEIWQYRGEGNANVVLALSEIKKVIRIRKRPRNVSPKYDDQEKRNIEFYNTVGKKLFNPFVGDVQFIEIENNEIDKLNLGINKYRTAYRCSKQLDYNGSALLDDYCLLPSFLEMCIIGDTFSIEIKPKQGFINEFSDVKCFYCQNQYLKVAQEKINNVSNYCPLDLFSGNKDRIKYSINQLIQNPQNNFRLFKNGILTYDEQHDQHDFYGALKDLFSIENTNDDFCEFMHQVLTRNFSVTSPDIFCADCCFTKKTNILQSILSVQQLDKHQNLTARNLNYDDWNYVNIVIDDVMKKSNCILCALRSYWTMESNNSEKYLIPYLISAVAKDCSVMITFGKANERIATQSRDFIDNFIQLESGSFIFNIKVMDIYPKTFKTIQKHISRDAHLATFNDKVPKHAYK